MTITLVIDGSAKGNIIGAGLVVYYPYKSSPRIESFHQILTCPATSSLAEFFALRKAFEWIQTTNPKEPIEIITDSMEVATKIPKEQIPINLLPLYKSITSQNKLNIQQAKPIHAKIILLAHNASRAYLHRKTELSLQEKKGYPPLVNLFGFVSIKMNWNGGLLQKMGFF